MNFLYSVNCEVNSFGGEVHKSPIIIIYVQNSRGGLCSREIKGYEDWRARCADKSLMGAWEGRLD